MRTYGAIGIDLGTESIKAVALEAGSDGSVKVVGVGASLSEGLRKGIIVDIDAAAKSLAAAVETLKKTAGAGNGNIYAGIGGVGLGFQKSKGLVAISRADGEVSKEDLKRAVAASENNLVRVQNREILHSIPISYKIDNETITHDPVGLSGLKLEAETLFITVFAQHFKSIMKTFDEAGVSLEDATSLPIAVAEALLSKREKEFGVMVLDIGFSTTSLCIFEENYPYSLEVFPIGSGHITNDIAVGFQIPIEEAEKLKINYGTVEKNSEAHTSKKSAKNSADDIVYGHYSRKKLTNIIEDRLSDIFELTEKHLKKVGREGLLPGGVVIAGGGSNLPGIADYTREHLKLPARIAEINNLGGLHDKVKNPAWAGAVGIALMALEKHAGSGTFTGGTKNTLMRWLRAFLP
ncbi:MAG: cell division protein FtsA [bacterium]|nr:cell division protein FtsA [bacterium]